MNLVTLTHFANHITAPFGKMVWYRCSQTVVTVPCALFLASAWKKLSFIVTRPASFKLHIIYFTGKEKIIDEREDDC